jgi:hypothetical protein
MPVREFRDEAGTHWRVWNIAPEAIDVQAHADAYLADCFELGWIVFETLDGREKRRLCPYPTKWEDRSESGLRDLLAAADGVPPYRHGIEGPSASHPPAASANGAPPVADTLRALRIHVDDRAMLSPDVTDLRVVRSFRYPGGRLWSVCVVPRTEDGGGPVLRFSAGARHVDLHNWPLDWPEHSDQGLIDLLRTVRRPVGRHAEASAPSERRFTDHGR